MLDPLGSVSLGYEQQSDTTTVTTSPLVWRSGSSTTSASGGRRKTIGRDSERENCSLRIQFSVIWPND